MTHHVPDLEQIIEMEHLEQIESPVPAHTDQYGLDIECMAYREQWLWEVDDAMDAILGKPQLKQPSIIPVEDEFEVIEVQDDSPKILRYLKEH